MKMALDFSTSQLWTLGDDAKMLYKILMENYFSHKMQYPGKLLSKYESKIKAFLDLKNSQNFFLLCLIFGRLLENMIYQIKKFIEKERDMV